MEADEGPRARKRLVICCDGTWNRPDSAHVTNVEKIARTIETDLRRTGGVQQLALYLSGVGAGSYQVDRLLGGAFGFGLFANIRTAYRFLALNYDAQDEIFVFGFSRGAYTARSLVGMIGRVGLLTREALVADKLLEAVDRYRAGVDGAAKFKDTPAEFRHKYCHRASQVTLLGVFDTVGALGVPGAVGKKHQFHDVNLGPVVDCARQALALDERRLKFEPCVWEAAEQDRVRDEAGGRVEQVWFPGVHSDVGGGLAVSGLSDTTLLWMATEARRRGAGLRRTAARGVRRKWSAGEGQQVDVAGLPGAERHLRGADAAHGHGSPVPPRMATARPHARTSHERARSRGADRLERRREVPGRPSLPSPQRHRVRPADR